VPANHKGISILHQICLAAWLRFNEVSAMASSDEIMLECWPISTTGANAKLNKRKNKSSQNYTEQSLKETDHFHCLYELSIFIFEA
jgi:hypothetical protein